MVLEPRSRGTPISFQWIATGWIRSDEEQDDPLVDGSWWDWDRLRGLEEGVDNHLDWGQHSVLMQSLLKNRAGTASVARVGGPTNCFCSSVPLLHEYVEISIYFKTRICQWFWVVPRLATKIEFGWEYHMSICFLHWVRTKFDRRRRPARQLADAERRIEVYLHSELPSNWGKHSVVLLGFSFGR